MTAIAMDITDPRVQAASSSKPGNWAFSSEVTYSTNVISEPEIIAEFGEKAKLPRPRKTQPSAPVENDQTCRRPLMFAGVICASVL